MEASINDHQIANDDRIPLKDIQGSASPDIREGLVNPEKERPHSVTIHSLHNNMFSKRSRWTWIRIMMVLLLVVLLFTFICLWGKQQYDMRNSPCLKPICVQLASGVIQRMDTSIDPCNDFYRFACNGFLRNTYMPNDEYSWSTMRELTVKVVQYLKNLYETTSNQDDSVGFKLLQTYYKSCMNETNVDNMGFEPLFTQLHDLFGGWALLPTSSNGARTDNQTALAAASFNLTKLYLPMYKLFLSSHLARMSVEHDVLNTSRYVIQVGPPMTPVGRLIYLNDTLPHIVTLRKAYLNLMENYSKLIGVSSNLLHELEHVFEFETEIARRTPEQRNEKSSLFVQLDELTKLCPIFDWKLLLQERFSEVNYTIKDNETIQLQDKEYLMQRCNLVEEYTKTDQEIRKLHNAAIWFLLYQLIEYMPSKAQVLYDNYNKFKFGLEQAPPRWMHCVNNMPKIFNNVIGKHFVRDQFTEATKLSATRMVVEIKEMYKENFASVEWMMEDDKVKAIEKVERMRAHIGYPENCVDPVFQIELNKIKKRMHEGTLLENTLICESALNNHGLSRINNKREEWDLPPFIVNAFYQEGVNSIFFPAGILQTPIYDSLQPESFNYGGIGMVVGHEITHAFDSNGAKRDAAGNLRQWWSNETVIAFEERSQCMIDQYNNYQFDNISLNGNQTLGENIADNGGLKAAYHSFKKLPASKRNVMLPGLSYTPEQLFFIAFGQSWCTKSLKAAVIQNVIYDVHTIEEYRVTGTLQNSDEFAEAFNCPRGTPMNPTKKCKIW